MAEELGHIDIRFPNAPGGGAGDTTGPLPTKASMPDIGSSISTMLRAASGDFTAIAQIIVNNVISAVGSIKQFVDSSVAEMRERGKFSPEVMMENVAAQMQALSNQFQEAKVLGPLYATILRWYRELMQMLQPWKLLFQAIIAFLTGAILGALQKLMSYLNAALPAILNAINSLLQAISTVALTLAAPGGLRGAAGAAISGFMGGQVGIGMSIADAISDSIPDIGLQEMLKKVGELAELTRKSITQLQSINTNTSPQTSGGLDWVAAQLREIASRSPNFGVRKATNPFWQTTGKGRFGGYP